MRRVLMAIITLFIFIGTSPSFADDCGHANTDGAINILDVVHIINYKYKDGPPPNCGPATDYDGNTYGTITIGNQVWMTENLKVTHYRNGDPITNVTDGAAWAALTTEAYCEYGNNIGNVDTYGRLYNWYAANDSRGLAPEGWRIPTDDDWKELEIYLGMSPAASDAEGWRETDEGGKLKEVDFTHWTAPNTGATNESGFTALPSGFRSWGGNYNSINLNTYFWSSTEFDGSTVWRRHLNYVNATIDRYYSAKFFGFSIRCIKD